MRKRMTSAVWVKGIAEMLAAEGIDARALFAGAGIDFAALDAPGARLPTEKISRLWELAAELKQPLPTSNPVLAGLHERFAGDYLRHFDHAQTSRRVRELIVRLLPDGEPRRDQVAGALCMSERTLQRRLEGEATSFLQLLYDTRRELAEQYLGRLHLSLAQAAYLLRFADQSSFFRACKRWFEVSPGQYRSQLRRPDGNPWPA